MKRFTIGSLFDGSGGFPLAASMCGGVPVWASEIEPYPIAVTKSRFPQMEHLGDISKINGAEIEPVDVITFGSPCQDMSVANAGKRAGLKHEAIGDDETTRSGLFMEAVRVAIEMRRATNGKYPKFMLWENVPGAFSSNKGEDFRIVLEELIKIVEPYAVMPSVPSGGWAYADCYIGDGWSLAYRVFDAQYWGVPQRRRRIHLILDLTGQRAGEILFEREGVRGYFETSRTPWQGTTTDAERSIGAGDRTGECVAYFAPKSLREGNWAESTIHGALRANESRSSHCVCVRTMASSAANAEADRDSGSADRPGECLTPWDSQARRVFPLNGIIGTLQARSSSGQNQQAVLAPVCEYRTPEGYCKTPEMTLPFLPYCVPFCSRCYDARGNGDGEIVPTIAGDHNRRVTDYTTVVTEPVYCKQPTRYIVRRLTPLECARLQGFPDEWGHPDYKESLTNDEYAFWMGVRNVHAVINGKQEKQYTREQMVKWYNGLHTDSAEYKMWGNGIALPPALYCMQGIAEAFGQKRAEET